MIEKRFLKPPLKQRLKSKELTIGSWITIGHPAVAEVLAASGFDWLAVDMEHSSITVHQAQQLIQAIELNNSVPLVRVGENNPNIIKRVMDAGAHGVIVPMVNSREDALRAVSSVNYPPRGTRGVGLARAQGYGFGFESYKEWLAENSVVIVQIEHIDAVCNLEDILSTKGVDAFIVGPYDLSGSLGRPGDFDHPDVASALNKIKRTAEKMNHVSGFHVIPPDWREVEKKKAEGYRFIAFSLDTLFLGTSCKEGLKKLKKL
ncbi:MAG: 2,4-dihydroxyhept-2-ene-1,7-dioic acid aldolase [Deltaproteobacteria bacterium]|nr:2,4-dihydroxyhept-2-ene-1,7-dioic acid aldolase [Deltaproteobacteria bacterium]